MDVSVVQELANKVKLNIQKVMVGKDKSIDQILVAMIASGHVLLEDVPGTGKTLLAKSMAKSLSCSFNRIQFTPDLLPTDVTGLNFYSQKESDFIFKKGPIFSNIILADEVNRATPRTQSSLLECMEEKQVTIDGETKQLNEPFMIIATQNPVENQGTFPLPEAQLDRFLIKLDLGYPTKEEGIAILKRFKENNPIETLSSVATTEDIIAAQRLFTSVYVSDDLLEYMLTIVEETRHHPKIELGISPRGSQALLKAVQAYAAINGRSYVIPDDIKEMLKPVVSHRMVLTHTAKYKKQDPGHVLDEIVATLTVPAESIETGMTSS
ncbi:MoxR family ATPase [Halalkalibacter sp. APA_J-10(15)]|uniref:AAA family ATPase n=1 Tax=unclassified Halalkalibacter TaxID=2893063 RepID=UPI001FF6D46E|nr:MoxR family ATPase [Halalkalibacter sp. APA_J-10(15)]MCK0473100.1 MoxR family ATPase [Halalkalibacter sp. APA_J-10(15)]